MMLSEKTDVLLGASSSSDAGEDSSLHVGGSTLTVKEEAALVVEQKDWKLIRSNLNTSLKSRGMKPELFWGGVGLMGGSFVQVVQMIKNLEYSLPNVCNLFLFAIGFCLVIDASCAFLQNKQENKRRIGEFETFLDDIERKNSMDPSNRN